MSTSGRPISEHPTRQQLDELDALMERMLALPVNPPVDVAAVPIGSPSVPARENDEGGTAPSKKINASSESNARVEAAQQKAPGCSVIVAASDFVVSTVESKLASGSEPTREPASVAQVDHRTPGFSRPAPEAALAGAAARRREWESKVSPALSRTSLWLHPVVSCNRLYDMGTSWMGPAGEWLRGWGGRRLLGLAGLVLLVGAVAWIVFDTWPWTW